MSALVWYFVPLVVAVVAAGYVYSAMVLHVNPPVVPVQGVSMQPTLKTGDLVFLSAADPSTLKKGDIIAIHVSQQEQNTYGVPANVVHRIVKIEQGTEGRVFITKGDNNPGPDVFHTQAAAVVGRVRYVIPYAGFPILFVQSKQGKIFLGAAVLVGLLYFAFGMIDERRAHLSGTFVTMKTVLEEVEKLEREIASSNVAARSIPSQSRDGPLRPTEMLALTDAESGMVVRRRSVDDEVLATVIKTVSETSLRSIQMENVVGDLAGAIGEYATHLQSHTSAVQDLARVARHLDEVLTAPASFPDTRLARSIPIALSAPVVISPDPLDQNATSAGDAYFRPWMVSDYEENLDAESRDYPHRDGDAELLLAYRQWDVERWEAYESWCAGDEGFLASVPKSFHVGTSLSR